MAKAYGVDSGNHASRTTFVIDAQGKVVKVLRGLSALSASSALEACPLRKPA